MRRAGWMVMIGGMIVLSSCTIYFDAPLPSEDAPVELAPFLGTWEGVSMAGQPMVDPVTLSLVEFGDDLRFAITAAPAGAGEEGETETEGEGEAGAEETIAGELRLAAVDDRTYASARVEGTAGWITLQVSGPEDDELSIRPVAEAAMEQAVAARVVSGTAQNSALGARGLFIHEDAAGLTRFLSENPQIFEDGTEVVLRRVDGGPASEPDDGAAGRASGSGAAAPAAAPNAFSRNPVVRAVLGTVAGVLIVALLMVAFSSRGRRR